MTDLRVQARFVVHFLAVSTILALTKHDFAALDTLKSDSMTGDSNNSPRFIYDVSSRVTTEQNFSFDDMHFGVVPGATFLFYYGIQDTVAESDNWFLADRSQDNAPISFVLNEKAIGREVAKYFVFNSSEFTTAHLTDPSVHAIVIVLRSTVGSCDCLQISDYVEKLLETIKDAHGSVQVGLEYDKNFIIRDSHLILLYYKNFRRCCELENFITPEDIDFFLVTVHIPPIREILSYQQFSKVMEDVIDKNRNYLERGFPHKQQLVRLVIKNRQNIISTTHFPRYEAQIVRYMQAFSKNHIGNETFIITPTPNNLSILGSSEFFKKRVGIVIHHSNPCDLAQLMNSIYQNIFLTVTRFDKRFYVPFRMYSNLGYCLTLKSSIQPNTKLNILLPGVLAGQIFDANPELSRDLDFVDTTVFFGYSSEEFRTYEEDKNNLTFYQLKHRNIRTGCYMYDSDSYAKLMSENISSFIATTHNVCLPVFNQSAEVLQRFHLDLNFVKNINILAFLTRLQKVMHEFKNLHPDKTFIPLIMIDDDNGVTLTDWKHRSYCDSRKQFLNGLYETVLTFASIHNWTQLLFDPDPGAGIGVGLWNILAPDSSIDIYKIDDVTVIYRSNTEISEDGPLPMTYSCIKWTEKSQETGIDFLRNIYSGTTFNTKLRINDSLATNELQTALLYSLERFNFVEVVTETVEEFKQVQMAMSSWLLNAIRQFRLNLDLPLVYIEVPLQHFLAVQQLESTVFSQNFGNASTIHVTGWENQNASLTQDDLLVFKNFTNFGTLGLTVQNCSQEVNQGFRNLLKVQFLSMVSYLVCNASPVIPKNVNKGWMHTYLGTLFFTKSYIEKVLLKNGTNVEVMFRINLKPTNRPCQKKDTNQLLCFLNDVNQHSAAYKIRYFIVRGFEGENVKETCTHTWWSINNYTNLANSSVYVERENEFFNRETRLETKIPSSQTTPGTEITNNIPAAVYYITIPVFVLAILSILLLWLHLLRLKKRLLTQQEVTEFYDGIQLSDDSMAMTDINLVNTMHMKFQKSLEISISDLQIGTLIGSGQFGVVHKGLLRTVQEVAIKIPRSDGGVEQFKSALSELKMHCFIGTHPNVVCLLGAYTKAIATGKLFIVTEYCEEGSLLGHLLELQKQMAITENDSNIELYQLYAFSLQIARGMEYVSEKRVIHGDLATRNVLLTSDYTCKIADFGLSRRLYELNEYQKTSKEPLPWRWLAPESLTNSVFTTKSDVWSYGVTLWEIFSLGRTPYPGKSWNNVFVTELCDGMRMERAQLANEKIHEKMLDCWNSIQEERPTFNDLVRFFVGMQHEEYSNID